MSEPGRTWRRNAVYLLVFWVALLALSLSVLSSVITPFLRTLQTQDVVSTSWAGYAVGSNLLLRQPAVVAVNGSWTVPAVNVSEDNRYSSAWIGIGGQSDHTLIQVGTEHDSLNGQAKYSAWYEMLPDNSIAIPEVAVSSGDRITASVSLVDTEENEWLVEIHNLSNGQGFSQIFTYNSSMLSAEWVVERPMVNNQTTTLTDFGSVTFTNATAQLRSKVGTISSFPNYAIVMSTAQNVKLTQVSPLSKDGSSFNVTYIG